MVALTTILVAGIHYLLHPQKLGTITATINPDAIIPVTLLSTEEIFGGRLEQLLDEYARVDDVFTSDFGAVLIEKVPEKDTESGFVKINMSREIYQLEQTVTTKEQLYDLPSGPYILYGPNLYQAWRLYEDHNGAFNFGVIPTNVTRIDRFQTLNVLGSNGDSNSIAVPSRLYYPNVSEKKPLSGVRLAVPDTLPLKGVRTTLSSRAWTALYPSGEKRTAKYAQRLMDLGAVIVGKTKVSQLISGNEWVDEQAPWNPRADGYQISSGSSSGAAVALAGYDWLEYSIGEDSIDGLRTAAASDGVYALRPSFANSTLTDVYVSSQRFDSIAVSARSLEELEGMVKVTSNSPDNANVPNRFIYLSDFDLELPKGQLTLLEAFVGTMENFLGSKAHRLNLQELWNEQPPSEAHGASLSDFMGKAVFRSFCYDYAASFGKFRDEYRESFKHEPFIESIPLFRWEIGLNMTSDDYASDLERIQIFRAWFEKSILGPHSSTLVAMPFGPAKANYRQDNPSDPEFMEGLAHDMLAPVLGAPHLVVPFSQIAFESKVSGSTEYLPFSGSVLGPRGSDAALVAIVKEAFGLANRTTNVETGRHTFPPRQMAQDSEVSHILDGSNIYDELRR